MKALIPYQKVGRPAKVLALVSADLGCDAPGHLRAAVYFLWIGGRSKTTGIIDVALLPILARRGNVEELAAGYGFIIVDECHRFAAAAFPAAFQRSIGSG